MKAVAFVPVRLTSSRLPEKHLKKIGDRTLLSWVIKRLKDCAELDDIVICAPDEPESQKLTEICRQEGVKLYIHPGDVNDVVGRLTTAAKLHNADICVLASGDCPLLEPSTIDKLVGYLKRHPDVDIADVAPLNDRPPIHEGIFVARREVWELADKYSETPELREHQFPVLKVYPRKFADFKKVLLRDKEVFYAINHRISVDTPKDLRFMNRVYEELVAEGKTFDLKNVIELLLRKSEILKINADVKQKDIGDKTYNVLFVIGKRRNLLLALEIADYLTSLGIGVSFFVLNSEDKRLCEERFFRAEILKYKDRIYDIVLRYRSVVLIIDKDLDEQISCNVIEGMQKLSKIFVIDDSYIPTELMDCVNLTTYRCENIKEMFKDSMRKIAEMVVENLN